MIMNYLFMPWLALTSVIFLIELAIYIKRQVNVRNREKAERQRYKELKQLNSKRKTKVKKRRRR